MIKQVGLRRMYRTGIWKAEGLRKRRTFLGKMRQYSYSLLRMPPQPTQADIALFETVLNTVFTSSGICRTTYPSRFRDVDCTVQPILERIFSPHQPFLIHDFGASDCLLSLVWAKSILASFPEAHCTASDTMLYLTEAVHHSKEAYALEPDGTVIQYTSRPFVVSMYARESVWHPVNVLVRAWARRRLSELQTCYRSISWNGVPDRRQINTDVWSFRQLPLVHPFVLAFERNRHFSLKQLNAFFPLPIQCDVTRAMNLFQSHALPLEQIHKGIWAVLESTAEGGVFIAGKTVELEGKRNDVTIFRKTRGRATVITRLGRGFEFEPFVMEYRST